MSTSELIRASQDLFEGISGDANDNNGDALLQLWNAQSFAISSHVSYLFKTKRHVALVLDIEGTTTPLPFVTKVLYPHSETHLAAFLSATIKSDDPGVSSAIAQAAASEPSVAEALGGGDKDSIIRAMEAHLRQLIAVNSKAQHLKYIQGRIWKSLYESGTIRGHVFPDAVRFMNRLNLANGNIARDDCRASIWIYSSGSIAAQKLLFGYSTSGDLNPTITGYFDPSTVGPKVEAASYSKIREVVAKTLSVEGCAGDLGVIFFTDHLGEVAAARASQQIDAVSFVTRPLNNIEHSATIDSTINAATVPPVFSIVSFDQLVLDNTDHAADDSPTDLLQKIVLDVKQYMDCGSQQMKSFL